MIKIDFTSAISVYLSLSIFLVFILWIFYNHRRNGILNETKYLQQCPYCAYMFFNYASEKPAKIQNTQESGDQSRPMTCPRCKSYIDFENNRNT